MAIKVTTPEKLQEKDVKPFPKLMVSDEGDVFYMVREKYGLPLMDKNHTNWAFHLDDFADFSGNQRTFTDYNDPITIQNA